MKHIFDSKQTALKYIICTILSTFLALPVRAAATDEKRIYQVSPSGQIQYNKPSFTIRKDGRIIETNQSGRKMYHLQQYQIKNGEIYSVSVSGMIEYNKPKFKLN